MNVIIVHGSNENEEEAFEGGRENIRHWHSWLRKELSKRNISISGQLYPEDWEPKYESWKNEFEKNEINEKSILVGHSSGGGFLVRWIGESKKKVKKLILVAPAIMHSGEYKPLKDLLKFEIDKNIKDFIEKVIIFASSDDSKGILKSVEIFSKAFDVNPIMFKDKGHFTLEDMGTEEFPELLDEILND